MRIFISHAKQDVPVVEEFVSLLKQIGVPPKNIFCTSMPGHGVPAGKDLKSYIRDQFGASDIVIAIVSENYYASAFCMCELGAVWITAKERFFPFLVPPVTFGELKGTLVGTQCLRLEDAEALSELRDEIDNATGHACNTPMWDKSREVFLSRLESLYKEVPKSPTVPRNEYDKITRILEEYKTAVKTKEEDNAKLREECDRIAALKDREQVRAVSAKFKSEEKNFEHLLGEAKHNITALSSVVREALFHFVRGEEFVRNCDEWQDEPRRAEESGQLKESAYNENVLTVDERDPDVADAVEAFNNLAAFVETASKDLKIYYLDEYRERLDLRIRPFWKRWFKLS